MSDPVEPLILDLLEWIGPHARPYAEVLEAWRTSCPRLPVWEEANQRGFIAHIHEPGRTAQVAVSPLGLAQLTARRAQPVPFRSPQAVLRHYFHAKDENRPHLLVDVFAPGAELEVRNHTATISFPALTQGREAIAEVLVTGFGRLYEDVYSFYMAQPPLQAEAFSCDWLVAMSEKDSKSVRVGCGRYDWFFEQATSGLATRLAITIEAMQVLPPGELEGTFAWVHQLNYPWSSAQAVCEVAPSAGLLGPVLQYLGRHIDR